MSVMCCFWPNLSAARQLRAAGSAVACICLLYLHRALQRHSTRCVPHQGHAVAEVPK